MHRIRNSILLDNSSILQRRRALPCHTHMPLRFAQLGNYASLEGVLYCRPHFDQLLKTTGSFEKSFDQQGEHHLPLELIDSILHTQEFS